MMKTDYHAKYFSYDLTKRCSSDTIEKFVQTLSDAQVQLNPHQIDAALFAFKSPLSKGAILADEVGLGKTIEAGIILSQYWAERKRKILLRVRGTGIQPGLYRHAGQTADRGSCKRAGME